MNLSPSVAEWAADYEKKFGRKPKPDAIKIAEHLEDVWNEFEEAGRKDAAQGLPMRSDEVFKRWGKWFVESDEVLARRLSDVARSRYMDGYNENEEATE